MHTEIPEEHTLWAAGPWDDEPDREAWVDQATGLHCLILRHPEMGHLCGYVFVPPTHPKYGTDGDDLSAPGGITATGEGRRMPRAPEGAASHWLFGFDCAHAEDLTPLLIGLRLGAGVRYTSPSPPFLRHYRTLGWVRERVTELAAQLGATP